MEINQHDILQILDILKASPSQIKQMTEGFVEEKLHQRSEKEPWSAFDVLGHLKACADVWGHGIFKMLDRNNPTTKYISPRTWIKKSNYAKMNFEDLLSLFSFQRDELILRLTGIKISEWMRSGIFIKASGNQNESVFRYARRMAFHECQHWEQFKNLLA